ncbi:MAG: bifunctional demethylmenaquinone methyltransferase/2-methoxy-6-polyprenyl-1,4-benzoquinol methylase UbiE [Pyrinomonadaceae bacterium]
MNQTSSKQRSKAELNHAKAVHEMFSGIAGKYDILNHFLSANIDKRWRRMVVNKLSSTLKRDDAYVLDVACGTGDLSVELKNGGSATVIGTDFCRPMLEIATSKNSEFNEIEYLEADGMNLCFANESFDAVTIAFGLRNFSNWEAGLKELRRILKPEGEICVLEFSSPVVPGFKQAFNFYFANVLPRIGGVVSGSRGAYEYLPNSVSRFPNQEGLAEMMRQIGFCDVKYTNLTGGIAAIHTGKR